MASLQSAAQRQLGRLRGKIRVRKDFDAPLPDELLDAFEGEDAHELAHL